MSTTFVSNSGHNKPAGLHECLLKILGNRTIVDLTYKDLQKIASDWIAIIDTISITNTAADASKAFHIIQRRCFNRFFHFINPHTPFERSLIELFLMARLHPYVVSYLSLQEGRDWDTSNSKFIHTSKLLTQIMIRLGKRHNVCVWVRFYFIRFRLNIDPFQSLRSLYYLLLKKDRKNGNIRISHTFQLVLNRFLFRKKSFLLRILFRRFIKTTRNYISEKNLLVLFHDYSFQRNISLFILLLFPNAKLLTKEQWNQLFKDMGNYFVPRVCVLTELLPDDSMKNNGIIKMLKMTFGVIAGRVAERDKHEPNELEFIFNTLRLAYSWGITYPLVDNVLDSDIINPEVKHNLVQSLCQLFDEESLVSTVTPAYPLVEETVERLTEVISLVPAWHRSEMKRTMLFLLEAHQRDSERRLRMEKFNSVIECEMWADSLLKATLIRVATMNLCGTIIDSQQLASQIKSSVNNQFGDDFWDIYEDFEDNRVTPFTAFFTGRSQRDPFCFFLRYCIANSSGESEKRRIAMQINLLESMRCVIKTTKEQGHDNLNVVKHVEKVFTDFSKYFPLDLILYTPHIDPDTVLFELEKSLLWAQ